MKVGVLGSGEVGRRLSSGIAEKGHDVQLGTGHPGKKELKEFAAKSRGAVTVTEFAKAASHGELLLLCCTGSAVDEVIRLSGPKNFEGKVLIDVTNPLEFSRGMPPGLFVGTTDSLGERIQKELPRARVVKCFNIVPNPLMTNPQLKEGKPTMLFAGNDASAKERVAELLRELGWEEPIDIGGIEGARWLEALVPLWVRVASKVGNYSAAFRVLRS